MCSYFRTEDVNSPRVPASEIAASVVLFSFLYVLLFVVWDRALNRKARHGPDPADPEPPSTGSDDFIDASTLSVSPTPYSLTDAKPDDGGDLREDPGDPYS